MSHKWHELDSDIPVKRQLLNLTKRVAICDVSHLSDSDVTVITVHSANRQTKGRTDIHLKQRCHFLFIFFETWTVQFLILNLYAKVPIAQSVRAPVSGTLCWGFDDHHCLKNYDDKGSADTMRSLA